MDVRNDTKGVMNVGGKVIAPGKTADVDDKTPGLDGALMRKSLSRVTAARQTKQTDSKTETKE